jgi:para-aminobenzoate synthetase/4-amino-4-deoxychorismate lyase
LKAEFLTGSARRASGGVVVPDRFLLIETMLWDGGIPLIELHLDRLMDSVEYFGFDGKRLEIRARIEDRARGFADGAARKVRLLFDREGELQVMDEILPAQSDADRIGRVYMESRRTDSADRWLYHKTTQRPLYVLALRAAVDAGFDDVLFMNEREEVTEGAISNVFVQMDGKWLTPPVECGLLSGVYRRHLLETLTGAEEGVLYAEDLRRADAVYLCNAVRGLRRVTIEWEE